MYLGIKCLTACNLQESDNDDEEDREIRERREREKEKRREEEQRYRERRSEGGSRRGRADRRGDSGKFDPMDPSSYSDAPRGSWSSGLEKDKEDPC